MDLDARHRLALELHRAQAACNWSYFTLFSVEKYMEQLDNASERIGKELWRTQE